MSCENEEATDTRGRGVVPECCDGHTADNNNNNNNNNNGLEFF